MNIETPREYVEQYKKQISLYDDNKKLIFSEKDLIASLAYWAIKQSPKVVPNQLKNVLERYQDHIKPYFDKLKKEDLGFIEMDLKTLKKFIKGNLITIKEFKKWNLSELELKHKINTRDNNRGNLCNQFITIFDDPNPLYDFIDLDALIRNSAHFIYDENEKIK